MSFMASNVSGFAGNDSPAPDESRKYSAEEVRARLLGTSSSEGGFRNIMYLESPPGYGKTSFAGGGY